MLDMKTCTAIAMPATNSSRTPNQPRKPCQALFVTLHGSPGLETHSPFLEYS